jgi:hypothetical protein
MNRALSGSDKWTVDREPQDAQPPFRPSIGFSVVIHVERRRSPQYTPSSFTLGHNLSSRSETNISRSCRRLLARTA